MRALLDLLPLNGNKTYLSGIALLLLGVGGIILKYADPTSEFGLSVEQGIQLILAGLAALGIGHKVDKMLDQQRVANKAIDTSGDKAAPSGTK